MRNKAAIIIYKVMISRNKVKYSIWFDGQKLINKIGLIMENNHDYFQDTLTPFTELNIQTIQWGPVTII